MRVLRYAAPALLVAALVFGAAAAPAGAQGGDPFEALRRATGSPVSVPPRALAVIPERHTNGLVRLVDELSSIEPRFDDLAIGAGLNNRIAIQLRTREANIPIFVSKTDATISTVLALRLSSPIEVVGLVVERGGHYLMLASDVRVASVRGR